MADIVSLLQTVNATVGAQAGTRIPIQWQSVYRERRGQAPLLMTINPQQVQFQQPKRIQRQDTRGGVVFYHFSNARGQNNDILTLSLSGTTGNIDPRAVRARLTSPVLEIGDSSFELTNDQTRALDNLRAWVSFYELTQEPMLDQEIGIPNIVTMTYASTIFRKPILFNGFFQNVLQFSESAQEPFQRQWSAQFVVTNTSPRLDQLSKYLNNIITTIVVNG